MEEENQHFSHVKWHELSLNYNKDIGMGSLILAMNTAKGCLLKFFDTPLIKENVQQMKNESYLHLEGEWWDDDKKMFVTQPPPIYK